MGYFQDRNYLCLYAHVFADKIGNRLVEIFTGAFFYSLGMPLPFVLLFFGFEFGLRGAVAPIAPILVSKIGVKKAVATAYFFLVLFFIFVGLTEVSLVLGFLSFIFHSVSRGIYYPCVDTLHSALVHDESRGRQNTLEKLLAAIAGLLAVGIGASILANAFTVAIFLLSLVLLLSLVPLFFIDALKMVSNPSFLESYRYLFSLEFRENIVPLGAESLAIIANILVAPLYIFFLVQQEFSPFSAVIFIGILLQMALTLVYGVWLDRAGHQKTLVWASFLQAVGNIGYILATRVVMPLPLLTAFNNTAWDMYTSNYNTRVQQKASKAKESLIFNTAVQMTLCFVEVIALTFFALIAWMLGTVVFPLIFLFSIVGLYVSTRYFKD